MSTIIYDITLGLLLDNDPSRYYDALSERIQNRDVAVAIIQSIYRAIQDYRYSVLTQYEG